jgi:hypothetical protein
MHFLVVDDRFATPIYVILGTDPCGERDFPALQVREIILEERDGPNAALGRDPASLDRFREFRSDRAVASAGFILIEPRYVGPSWQSYLTAFRPEGDAPTKSRVRDPVVIGRQSPRPTPRPPSDA